MSGHFFDLLLIDSTSGLPGVCTSPALLPSHSCCPPTPPALPLLLPSHSSCPPTPFALPCPPKKGGHKGAKEVGGQEEWEGRRSGRAGGVGGQEEGEGRRRGRASRVGGHVKWEDMLSGRACEVGGHVE